MKTPIIKQLFAAAVFSCTLATPAFASVMVGTNPTAQSITDNATISSTINIGTTGTINSLEVSIAVDHTWVGDLIYTLTHGATTITLMDRPGILPPSTGTGDSSNLSTTAPLIFRDSASAAAETIGDGCNDIETVGVSTGCLNTLFAPQEALSLFNDDDVFGDWVLTISDNASGDTGRLASWSLTADVSNSVPEPSTLALAGLALAGMGAMRRRRPA